MPAEKSAKPPKSAPGPATKAPAAPAAKTPAAPAKAASKKPAPAPTAPAAKTIKAVPVKNTAEPTKIPTPKPPHQLPKNHPRQPQQPGRPCRKPSPEKTPDPGCHRRCYSCGCGCNQDAPRQARPQAQACQPPEGRPGQHPGGPPA